MNVPTTWSCPCRSCWIYLGGSPSDMEVMGDRPQSSRQTAVRCSLCSAKLSPGQCGQCRQAQPACHPRLFTMANLAINSRPSTRTDLNLETS